MNRRIRILQEMMAERGFDGALIGWHRDLYYYAGTTQPCNLFVPVDAEPILFARRVVDLIRSQTDVENIVEGFDPSEIIRKLSRGGGRKAKIGLQEDVLPAKLYAKLAESFRDFVIEDISPVILAQRMVKERSEVEMIKRAASLYHAVHRTVTEFGRPGVTELELAAEVYRSIRRDGAENMLFYRRWDAYNSTDGDLASGPNAAVVTGLAMTVSGVGLGPAINWGASRRRLRKGDLLVVDMGMNREGYHGDVTRSYVIGRSSEKQKRLFRSLLKVQQAGIEALGKREYSDEVYKDSLRIAVREGLDAYFQGHGRNRGDYIGHGIGLEVDEPPTLRAGERTKLQRGMVLTIEPKFMIPGWGGMMIEDDFLLTENGPEFLSDVERELFEVG